MMANPVLIDFVIQWGALGILALCFVFTLWFLLKSFARNMLHMSRSIRINSAVTLGMQQQLNTHDLTVRGLNPTTGGTEIEKRAANALTAYRSIQKSLEEQQRVVIESLKEGP